MDFLGKVKNVTGLGLSAQELYRRAFQKGVLLGSFEEAIGLFASAADKYQEHSDTLGFAKAKANQHLYTYLSRKTASAIEAIFPHLKQLPQIEKPGLQDEFVPSADLSAELRARQIEAVIMASSEAKALGAAHFEAAEQFRMILGKQLLTYQLLPIGDGHVGSVEERYFWHSAEAEYNSALDLQDADPIAALDKLSEAALRFRRAKDESRLAAVEAMRSRLRMKRTCWLCHREMQGIDLNINYYDTHLSRYSTILLDKLGQDGTSVDFEKQQIAVCIPCARFVQLQADNLARGRVQELRREMEGLAAEVARLRMIISQTRRK